MQKILSSGAFRDLSLIVTWLHLVRVRRSTANMPIQLQDIRDMGEALTHARELCQEAQYDKGVALFQATMTRLKQFLRGMTRMTERQPWLQMQIELENEVSLITDYVELIQAFKTPPGQA